MAGINDLIKLIPASERRVILERNLIFKAVANGGDYAMRYLMIVWREYIEPTVDVGCNACYQRVLTNYKSMQEEMIKMEQENKLLDEA